MKNIIRQILKEVIEAKRVVSPDDFDNANWSPKLLNGLHFGVLRYKNVYQLFYENKKFRVVNPNEPNAMGASYEVSEVINHFKKGGWYLINTQ